MSRLSITSNDTMIHRRDAKDTRIRFLHDFRFIFFFVTAVCIIELCQEGRARVVHWEYFEYRCRYE